MKQLKLLYLYDKIPEIYKSKTSSGNFEFKTYVVLTSYGQQSLKCMFHPLESCKPREWGSSEDASWKSSSSRLASFMQRYAKYKATYWLQGPIWSLNSVRFCCCFTCIVFPCEREINHGWRPYNFYAKLWLS